MNEKVLLRILYHFNKCTGVYSPYINNTALKIFYLYFGVLDYENKFNIFSFDFMEYILVLSVCFFISIKFHDQQSYIDLCYFRKIILGPYISNQMFQNLEIKILNSIGWMIPFSE